jgi:hypothetical protein
MTTDPTPRTAATARERFPREQDPYWAKRIAAHDRADLWKDPDAFLMHIQHEAWKQHPENTMGWWHHGVGMAMHLLAVHPAWRSLIAAAASPAGVSGEVCGYCDDIWPCFQYRVDPVDSHHYPAPAPTSSEPVERCVYRIRMLGLPPFVCNREEDDALHRSLTHPDSHDFTPATRDE